MSSITRSSLTCLKYSLHETLSQTQHIQLERQDPIDFRTLSRVLTDAVFRLGDPAKMLVANKLARACSSKVALTP